jgi:hypothetical protein
MSFSFQSKQVLFIVVFCFLLLPFFAHYAQAQSGSVAGIGLTPASIEESANLGEIKKYTVGVTNLSGVRQTYYLYLRDISGVKEGGVPIFAEENAEKTGYEMTDWVTLNAEEITLDPNETKPIEVTISVPKNATPCSHFGGMFVSMQPPKMRKTGASVGYEVAHIISLNVAGECVDNAQIRSFSTDNFLYSKPIVNFTARVENKGTTLIRPFGPLEIYNMFGKRVAMITLNDNKAGVFPKTERPFSITWEHDGPGFGRYEAIVSMVYGSEGRQSTISSTASFWILPINIILPALGVLGLLLLIVYVFIKMYVRNTIRNVSGGTRRIVRRRKNGTSALLLVMVVMFGVTALFLLILLALFA